MEPLGYEVAMRYFRPWLLLLLTYSRSPAQEEISRAYGERYKKAAPAVVGINVPGTPRSGTGFLVDPRGYLVTSSAVVQPQDKVIVYLQGYRRIMGRTVGRIEDKELVVIKISTDPLPFLNLGDSDAVQLGQTSLVIGDSFNSILIDDQPALSVGVISGRYTVTERHRSYTGPVLETSAAVNQNQDGAPLLDASGHVIGMMTLSYDVSRFCGLAIPLNRFKTDLRRLIEKDTREAGVTVSQTTSTGRGWLGLEVEDTREGPIVTRVLKKSPANLAGVHIGDRIEALDGKKIADTKKLNEVLGTLMAGTLVEVRVVRDAQEKALKIELARRPFY